MDSSIEKKDDAEQVDILEGHEGEGSDEGEKSV